MTTNIFILTGEKHSGKTTNLMRWMQGRESVSGILSPVIVGKRCFMNVETKEIFEMEAVAGEIEIFQVGKYVFSKHAFEIVSEILLKAAQIKQGWLIVDEVGPLELRGEGFHDVLKTILTDASEELKIVLVVRRGLVEEVLQKFKIKRYKNFQT